MSETPAPTMSREAAAKAPVGDKLPSENISPTTTPDGFGRRLFRRPIREAERDAKRSHDFSDVTVPRGEVAYGSGTGDKVEFTRGYDLRRQRTGERTTTIESETVRKNFDFLCNYVSRLGDDKDIEAILQDPARQTDKLLMDKLSKVVLGPDSRPTKRTVDMDKVYEHLQSSDGMISTTMLLEEENLLITLGAGMTERLQHQFSRGQKDQQRSGKAAVDIVPTIPGLAKKTLNQALLGLVSAGYVAVGTGKSKLEFKSDDELLYAVVDETKKDPQKLAYLRARTGIDLSGVNATKTVTGSPTITFEPWYNPDLDSLKARATNALSLRAENLEQLGFDKPARVGGLVPRHRQIRFAEEFIFDEGKDRWHGISMPPDYSSRRPTRAEDLPVGYTGEILNRYGELSAAHAPGASRYERLNDMAQARSEVLARYLQRGEAERRAVADGVKEGKVIDILKEKQKRMKEKPDDFRAEQRTKLIDKKTKAEAAKAAAEAKRAELLGGPDALGDRTKAVRALEESLTSDEFGVEISDDMEQAIKERRDALQREVRNALVPLKRSLQERFNEAKEAETRVLTGFKDAMDKIPTGVKSVNVASPADSITAALSSVEARFNPLLAPLQVKYDRLAQQLEALEAKNIEYQRAVSGEKGALLEVRAKEPEMIKKSQDAVDTFLGGGTPLLPSIDDIRTNSIQDLVNMQTTGTPEEKLEIALNAKAQEEAVRTTPIPKYQEDVLNDLNAMTPPITRDYVLRLDPSDLYTILEAHYAPSKDAKEKARKGAKAAFKGASTRLRALAEAQATQEVGYYEGTINTTDDEIKKLSDFKEKEPEVAAAVTILENVTDKGEDGTLSRVYEMAKDPQKVADLISAAPVTAADSGFSQAEIDLGTERYIIEWYRVLFPQYMEDPENRDEMFNAITRILPPAELNNFLNTHFYGVSGNELSQTTRELVNRVKEYALAA